MTMTMVGVPQTLRATTYGSTIILLLLMILLLTIITNMNVNPTYKSTIKKKNHHHDAKILLYQGSFYVYLYFLISFHQPFFVICFVTLLANALESYLFSFSSLYFLAHYSLNSSFGSFTNSVLIDVVIRLSRCASVSGIGSFLVLIHL